MKVLNLVAVATLFFLCVMQAAAAYERRGVRVWSNTPDTKEHTVDPAIATCPSGYEPFDMVTKPNPAIIKQSEKVTDRSWEFRGKYNGSEDAESFKWNFEITCIRTFSSSLKCTTVREPAAGENGKTDKIASCKLGQHVTGGGFKFDGTGPKVGFIASQPAKDSDGNNAWKCIAGDNPNLPEFACYAICCNADNDSQ